MSQRFGFKKYFLDDSAVSRDWQKGEYICREGGLMEKLYYILSGRVRIFRNLSNGRTMLYRIYLPGSVIGDIEIFSDRDASCSAQCISTVTTLSLPMEIIRSRPENYSPLLFCLGYGLARKLHENSLSEAINTSYSLESRLAHYYLTFTEPELSAGNLGQLSDWMGCSYRHLTRTLSELKKRGAIEKIPGGYRGRDVNLLKEIASPVLEEERGRVLFEPGEN